MTPSPASPPSARPTRQLVVVALVLLSAFILRVYSGAQEELREARAAELRGDVPAAVLLYRRAAANRLPFSPLHREALDRLLGLAAQAEQERQQQRALELYRSARAALLASRGVWELDPQRRRRVDDRIAALMAAAEPGVGQAQTSPGASRVRYRNALSAPVGPRLPFVLLALLGLVLVLAGMGHTLRDGVRPAAPEPGMVREYGLAVLGLALLTLGCALA